MHDTTNQAMKDCIHACENCHHICTTHEGLDHPRLAPEHLRLMRDCAEICETAANFMLARSPYHHKVCALCEEICDACAESCAKIDGMQRCVEVCRRCAGNCHQVAKAG